MPTALGAAHTGRPLPDILTPEVCLKLWDDEPPEEIRAAALEWVFSSVLDFLELQELRDAGLGPEEAAKRADQKVLQRRSVEHAVAGHHWWLGEAWATKAIAEWNMTVSRPTDAYRRLCYHSLHAVLRAYTVHDERCQGIITCDVAPPATQPRLPTPLDTAVAAPREEHGQPAPQEPEPQPDDKPGTGAQDVQAPLSAAREKPRTTLQDLADLSILDFMEVCIKEKAGKWKTSANQKATTAASMFVSMTGVRRVGDITKADAKKFQHLLHSIPRLHGKSIYKGMSPDEAVELANRLAALKSKADAGNIAAADEISRLIAKSTQSLDDIVKRLCKKTNNSHVTYMRQLTLLAVEWGILEEDPFAGLFYKEAKWRENQVIPRVEWSQEDLRVLLTAIREAAEKDLIPGTRVTKDPVAWAVCIALVNMPRMEEILQLGPDDVYERDGKVFLQIRQGKGNHLKNGACVRDIPAPPVLLDMGLMTLVAYARQRNQAYLFPGLRRGKASGKFSENFSKKFTRLRQILGIYEPGKDFHAFRSTLATLIQRTGRFDFMHLERLMGHAERTLGGQCYHLGSRPDDFVELVEAMPHTALISDFFGADAMQAAA